VTISFRIEVGVDYYRPKNVPTRGGRGWGLILTVPPGRPIDPVAVFAADVTVPEVRADFVGSGIADTVRCGTLPWPAAIPIPADPKISIARPRVFLP
jgi:hypothetical protein